MKIDDISQQITHIKNFETSGHQKTEDNKISAQGSDTNVQPGMKVDISSTSVEVSKAAELMEKVPDERAKRIEELKVMVRNDTYKADSKEIADKILDDPFANII